MSKQIAGKLGRSEITVEINRGHMMEKMGMRTFCRAGQGLRDDFAPPENFCPDVNVSIIEAFGPRAHLSEVLFKRSIREGLAPCPT
nr:LuxR C-terminal-related transcriptional regulator [Phyllobacterium sp. KW56]